MEKKTLWRVLLAAAFLFLLVPWAAQADIDPATVQKLLAGDGAAGDTFGGSVAVSADGSTAVIGALWHNGGKGAVYVFTHPIGCKSWSQQAELTVDENPPTGFLGLSVSVSKNGDTIVVGAPDHFGASIGAAYIFFREEGDTTWTLQDKLTGNGGAFGFSVSVSSDGSTALIGSIWGNGNNGEAYVFTRSGSTWMPQAKLAANDGAAGDHFGIGVSLSANGDTALIGAKGDDNTTGSAYIFTRSDSSSWTQQDKLVADDGEPGDSFGFQVALSGDGNTALVTAPYDDNSTGAAYIFIRCLDCDKSWYQQNKLIGKDTVAGDQFGQGSLSENGDIALIGAGGHDDWRGAAYIFTRSCGSWTQQTELPAPDSIVGRARFGVVSMSPNSKTFLIGAPHDDNRKGAAYVYDTYSNTIIVDAGGICTLSDAITAANTDTATGGCAAGAGDDTIILETDVELSAALPDITSTITIEGNKHSIDGQNDSAVGSVLKITSACGNLNLNLTTVTGGMGASYGGGIYASDSATVCLNKSTVSGNSAYHGGGIYASSGTVTITNSTISGNLATSVGSSSDGTLPMGGGINASSATITLIHSTVSENSASYGGGISASFPSTVIIKSSIISGNIASSGGNEIWGDYNVTANSFNLFGHSGESHAQAFFRFTPGSSDIDATSDGNRTTELSAIIKHPINGGGYYELVPSSPAIDLDAKCSTGLTEDQPGTPRPRGKGCDAGSYEFHLCIPCIVQSLLLKD